MAVQKVAGDYDTLFVAFQGKIANSVFTTEHTGSTKETFANLREFFVSRFLVVGEFCVSPVLISSIGRYPSLSIQRENLLRL